MIRGYKHMNKTTILVDGNAVAYTINLCSCTDENDFTKKYFSRLREYAKQFTSLPKFILFFDDKKGGTWREDIFPDYQKGRKLQTSHMTEKQIEELKLRSLYIKNVKNVIKNSDKFSYISYPHTEADDLISLYCNNIQEENETVVILTTDKDLFQLIKDKGNKKVKILFLVKREIIKDASIGAKVLNRKIMLGDNSDSIPNVCKNVGEKSIEDFVLFITKAKDMGIDFKDKTASKQMCESLGIKYIPSFSNYNEEQHKINKKLIDLTYVISMDKDNNNIKTNYIKDNLSKAKISPFALYGLV